MLQHEQNFPYDCLDEIFCYACDGSRRRALQLGLVCRFWYDRFKANDRMWAMLEGKGKVNAPKPRSWEGKDLYQTENAARNAARKLWPMRPENLHPIEDCTLEFVCPLYVEQLRTIAPEVSFCDVCNKEVYHVHTQKELEMRRAQRHCVLMSRRDMIPNVRNESVFRIAIVGQTLDQCRILCQAIISGFESIFNTEVQRSATLMTTSWIPVAIDGTKYVLRCFTYSDGFLTQDVRYQFCVYVGKLGAIQKKYGDTLPCWFSLLADGAKMTAEVQPDDVRCAVGLHLCAIGNGVVERVAEHQIRTYNSGRTLGL